MMLRRTLFLVITSVTAPSAFCQWIACSGGSVTCTNQGAFVGIGTTTPDRTLEVSGPNAAVSIQDSFSSHQYVLTNLAAGDGSMGLYDQTSTTFRWLVNSSGALGIGTTNPTCPGATVVCRLQVDGAIVTEEIVVAGGLADYVFRPDYRNRPLSEVAAYIKEHHHLPDVPSTEEAEKTGINVAEMQAKLLAKVEELTLHAIAAEKRSNNLEQENRSLRERLSRLEKRLTEDQEVEP